MAKDQIAKLLKNDQAVHALTKVLDQSEQVKSLVDECAEDLSSVNDGLKQELADGNSSGGIETALGQSEAVEEKVQQAADKLLVVNRSLEAEIKERKSLEAQLAEAGKKADEALHASLHDPLTGLPNRTLFNDRLEHGLAQARRHGYPLALMFVDLDDFKAINDSHGHETGDVVLKTIATRLKQNARNDDTVCRHGGDEFLYVLMEIQDEENIALIAQKIIESVKSPIEVSASQKTLSLSIKPSIGISVFPRHGTTAAELIDSADRAMYEAKRGKSGFRISD
jgi:diguanylate cyclase (GGDEF)-like protein